MATLPRLRPRDVLRPRGGGRAHPARSDPGRVGAPVPPAAQRRGAGHLPPPAARSRAWRRRSACRCSRSSSCRWRSTCAGFTRGRGRPAAPGDGLEAQSQARMERMRERLLRRAWPSAASPATIAEEIYTSSRRSPNFGFPESHSVSFAYLVYSSSWIKYHYPAEFAAALLNAQPMGFYSPHTIVRDARRHGVAGARPDLNASRRDATLEPRTARRRAGRSPGARVGTPSRRILAVRLGLRYVRGLHDALLDRIDDERGRAAVHRSRRLRAAHRRDRRPGRGARDRGRVRAVLRPVAPLGVVGRGRAGTARPQRRATARSSRRCPAWSPAPTRPRCRA